MAKQTLPINFKDDVLATAMGGKRRYILTDNGDGTFSLEDATTYTQMGDVFAAALLNAICGAVNESVDQAKVIDSVDTIKAITQAGYPAGSLAVKQLNDQLSSSITQLSSDLGSCRFGLTSDGRPGYKKAGADTVYPFCDGLSALVPTLAAASSNVLSDTTNANYPAWRVFDGSVGTSNGSLNATYFGYYFDSSVCVRMIVWVGMNANYPGIGSGAYVQASDDGSNWINVYSFNGDNSYDKVHVVAFDNYQYHKYWRVTMGSGGTGLRYLQFFGS